MKGIILNSDADNFVWSRRAEHMTLDGLQEQMDHYATGQVSHVFLNVNYMRTLYASETWENFWEGNNPETTPEEWIRNAWLLHEQGLDPIAVWIARLRERGVSPWVSMRMNDCHFTQSDPQYTLNSSFWREHPEYWRAPKGRGYHDRCLNYRIPAVREYSMSLVRELVQRYDADGLELDWLREPFCFAPGEEEKGRVILTRFMNEVRELTERWSKKRGHAIELAAHVPAHSEAAFGWGIDAVRWAKEGLIDVLIPSPRWATADFDIPIERWREMIGKAEKHVTFAAGMELRIAPYEGSAASRNNIEFMRGFSATHLSRGADQIYLYNHFDGPEGAAVTTTVDDPEEWRAILAEAGRLETVNGKPRRHIVTYADIEPPGGMLPRPLPAALVAGAPLRFRIHTGPKPSGGRAFVRVGLSKGPCGNAYDVEGAKLAVRLNGAKCMGLDDLKGIKSHPVYKQPLFGDSDRVAQFEVPGGGMKRGYNEIEVELVERGTSNQKIVWVEMYITWSSTYHVAAKR